MKEAAVIISAIFGVLLLSAVFLFFGLGMNRVAQPYQMETDRLTYQNSVARQQGANNGIGQDCANMEGATSTDKLAFARLVLTDAAAYSGVRGLSSQSQACVSEAHAALQAQ